jgi:RimJ/RimL family protein N-acetyltransferase
MTEPARFDTIGTGRLLMRRWLASDREPFAALNADPETMLFFPETLDRAASDAFADRIEARFDQLGYGLWALEISATGEFIGFTGLDTVDDGMPFTGIEVGWRLSRAAWGHGYATEAAQAALRYGFDTMGLPEIVAVAVAGNLRSQAVMRRIGMTTDPAEDFDEQDVDEGPLRRQVVYRKRRDPG